MDSSAETDRLSATYERMAQDFEDRGLDLAFVQENSTNYTLGADASALALEYTALPQPLSERAVRLCVLPLEEAPALLSAAAEVTSSIKALLPPGTRTYENAASLLHITAFHFSRPDDPRPVSMSADGADAVTATPISERPGPTDAEVERERQLMSELVSTARPVSGLQVHSVLFAGSGTLLLVYTEQQPDLAALRRQLRARAPGAPRKQASIIHTTLLRVLTPEQLQPGTRAAIQQACRQWTQQLRSSRLCITRAWYIIESLFATIDGARTVMHFGAA